MGIKKTKQGFTLMEIMMVVIILGMLATYAIPNYRKSILKGYEKQMIQAARSFYAAQEKYRYQQRTPNVLPEYWPGDTNMQSVTVDQINADLGTNIIPNQYISYYYRDNADNTYEFMVGYKMGEPNNRFAMYLWGGPNTELSGSNPACRDTVGPCPTLLPPED